MRGPALPPPDEADCVARIRSTIFGPTLAGWDRILEDVPIPVLRRGDWLQLPDKCAYATSLSTMFNGYASAKARTFYVWSHADVDNEAGALVELHKGTCVTQDNAALCAPEELISLTATPRDLGINVI